MLFGLFVLDYFYVILVFGFVLVSVYFKVVVCFFKIVYGLVVGDVIFGLFINSC